ncbi:DMT family transporter [Selenomonas ruminis]|uniref:DMT family transporter n=1 Tax=Selenomonas ruminis TaxID=2593411 RepID=A0A5D6W729_9FIRM|nr:DMT family transporter [Selenomonas sp. mPRGC5]TYZ24103.1 DMT family transporter [Selenomonas sp. mPRGC5]
MNTKRAEMLMLLVTFCWGSSYLFMKEGLASIGPFTLVAYRFLIAFAASAVFLGKAWRSVGWDLLKAGFIIGSVVVVSFSAMVIGLESTTTSNAGFITSLMVVFIPFVEKFVYHRPLQRGVVGTSAISVAGIGFLTLHDGLHVNPGDVLCLVGALINAGQVCYMSRLLTRLDPLPLGVIQFGVAGFWGLLLSLLLEPPAMPAGGSGWFGMLYLGLVCSAFGFIAQMVAQKYTSAERVGILFCLEPVFAAMIGVIYLHEPFSLSSFIGAVLVLTGVILSGRVGKKQTVEA